MVIISYSTLCLKDTSGPIAIGILALLPWTNIASMSLTFIIILCLQAKARIAEITLYQASGWSHIGKRNVMEGLRVSGNDAINEVESKYQINASASNGLQ